MLLISECIGRNKAGFGMGIRFTAITFSAFVAPLIFGAIAEYININWTFYSGTGLCSIFLIYLLILRLKKALP